MNVDHNDGKASEVDEVSTGTGKKKKSVIPRPTGNFNIRDAIGLSGSEKRWNKYSSILICFLLQCSLPFSNVFCYSEWLENLLGMCDLIGSWSGGKFLCETRPSSSKW